MSLSVSASPGVEQDLMPWAHEDPRLHAAFDVEIPRAAIGDVLKTLSRRSGVSFATIERDGAADFEIAVFLKGVTVFDSMSALRSLMSYRGGEWRWTRKDSRGSFSYT